MTNQETGEILEKAWDAKGKINKLGVDYARMIQDMPRLKNVNFSPLQHQPRTDYTTQTSIPATQVDQLGSAFAYYGDIGLVARYLNGKYLGKWRDKEAIISAVTPHILPERSIFAESSTCRCRQSSIRKSHPGTRWHY